MSIFIGLVLGLLVFLLGWSTLNQKLRTWLFRRAIEPLGFQPLWNVIVSNPTGWKLYSKGGASTAENIYTQMIGDVRATVFDYTYSTGYGNGRSSYSQTPVLLQPVGGQISLVNFLILPRGWLENAAGDIRELFSQANDADWLSRRYVIESGASGILPGLRPIGMGQVPLAQFLRKHPGLTVESDGIQMLVYRETSRTRAGALPRVINEALELMEVAADCRVGRVSKRTG